jgi:tetratricopeptide (TPR) repeat protein
LSEHLDLLAEEAISMWQRFLLSFHGDNRTVNVHLILGLLQYVQGRTAESLAEYKLVANRFPNSPLAAHALLNSSRVKAELRDYLGARNYLRQLVEQYPDSEIAEQSHMGLADNTLKAGMKDEAAKSYARVYNLSLSSTTQAASALGAGKCYYETQNYEEAIKWFSKYITITQRTEPDDLWLVYYMLGKSYLAQAKPVEACKAFEYALAGQLSREQYVETISWLIDAYIEREQFVRALGILEDIQVKQFSQEDSVRIILLKSKVLRAMGLFDKAIAILGDKAEYTLDPQLGARISFEIAKCHVDQGDWMQAEEKLTEVLVVVESGPLAYDASMTLVEVCLQLGRDTQAIDICRQSLDVGLTGNDRGRTLRLLAKAYNQQKDYDKAAMALMGRWK